jgi:hypothetical protein
MKRLRWPGVLLCGALAACAARAPTDWPPRYACMGPATLVVHSFLSFGIEVSLRNSRDRSEMVIGTVGPGQTRSFAFTATPDVYFTYTYLSAEGRRLGLGRRQQDLLSTRVECP